MLKELTNKSKEERRAKAISRAVDNALIKNALTEEEEWDLRIFATKLYDGML